MIRSRLLLGLVVLCAVTAGCLQHGAPPATSTPTLSSPSLTPMPSPNRPSTFTQSTAVEYIRQVEHQRKYNSLLDENTANIALGCAAAPVMSASDGYYVVAGCGGSVRLTPAPDATHLGAVGEIAAIPTMYFVNETTTIPVSYEAQKPNRPTNDSTGKQLTDTRHLFIYNFNQSAVKCNITITDVTGETPKHHSQYTHSLNSHKGQKIVRVVERTGTYRITVQTGQATQTYTWHVESKSKMVGLAVIITPNGSVRIEPQPELVL